MKHEEKEVAWKDRQTFKYYQKVKREETDIKEINADRESKNAHRERKRAVGERNRHIFGSLTGIETVKKEEGREIESV